MENDKRQQLEQVDRKQRELFLQLCEEGMSVEEINNAVKEATRTDLDRVMGRASPGSP